MPLHDVGYRPWAGSREGAGGAGVIAATGVRLAWQSRWLRRAVLFAWSPALAFATAFFAFEQAVEEGYLFGPGPVLRGGPLAVGFGELGAWLTEFFAGDTAAGGPTALEATRREVWARLLLSFMRAPQAVLLAIVVGLVAPPLIARDLRAKAWLFYFTRPLSRWDYILGKAGILVTVVAMITMVPALALWVVGVSVSPSMWVAVSTWDLPLRIVAASAALAVPTVLLALAYSSLTAESRMAAFAWFATWVACWIAHSALVGADAMAEARAAAAAAHAGRDPGSVGKGGDRPVVASAPAGVPRHRRHVRQFRWLANAAGVDATLDRWSWLSLYHALGVVQAWIFGIERRAAAVVPPCLSLAAVSLVSLAILAWRVDAPARV